MNKKVLKVLAGIAAVTLCVSALAACSSKESPGKGDSSAVSSDVVPEDSQPAGIDDEQESGGDVAEVTSEQIRALKADMTMEQVIAALGETQDVGDGENHVLLYLIDGQNTVSLPFAGDDAVLGYDGATILDGQQPIAR